MVRAKSWFRWHACLCVALVALGGCGNSAEKELLDMAKSAVERGLESWKRGDKPETLKSAAESIEFFDEDWIKGARLESCQVGRTFLDTDGRPKCAVELTLQNGSDPPSTQHVTYQVVKKPHVVVSRDPFN